MMRLVTLIAACALLAGCGSGNPVAKGAENTASLPSPADTSPDPTASAPANAVASTNAAHSIGGTKIPAAFHGRWGMTPQDCTSTRGDAKGLLTISADEMRFYESAAVPEGELALGRDSLSGDFSFTGEGQSWTKFQALRLQGRELVRTESNPTASYSYAKCT
jgi:hypothetical protein